MHHYKTPITSDDWKREFIARGILCHNKSHKPAFPHLITHNPTIHQDGAFIGENVWEAPELLEDLCAHLFRTYQHVFDYARVDRVVGIGENAIVFAYKVSEGLMRWTDKIGRVTFCTEKEMHGLQGPVNRYQLKTLVTTFPQLSVQEKERVLFVTNSIQTGHQLEGAIDLVRRSHGVVLPYVFTMCNASGKTDLHGLTICSLFSYTFRHMPHGACTACIHNSIALPRKAFGEAWRAILLGNKSPINTLRA